ncbi:pyridoxal phosphate-dependent aminotransferase [Anthocerotibacter panamensis]|uniref:pyridoxal phosphate-dependent aminotransferase n=1 Tax=Anthocerotibacter panamensis TaxID=2857077 RepID=UPI001C404E24|nr:aminotransferase class I/II-fold pyridoxal phosphate-dependent enzyme [Anthocerotibacter panamensis]
MLHPAQRLSDLRTSAIREMTRLALQHNAVNLAQGFPDFPPPPEVIAAARRALAEGFNQYTITWGIASLRAAISEKLQHWYGLDYDPERHISVTCGVTEAIVVALLAVADPGDEVIILEPFHENYLPATLFAQARPVFVPLEPPAYALDLDRLAHAFSDRTRAIILNTPHNPTGRVFTRTELNGVAALCRKYNALAITDEIYDHIIYADREHVPIATLEGMYERTITCGGLGKTFALTGWRLGYVCAPEPFATAMRTLRDFTTICAPAPLQHAAVAALSLPERFYTQLREEYTVRRQRMLDILLRYGFTAQPPEGAYYVMSDYRAWNFDGDCYAFVRWLVEKVGIAVVPGASFYAQPEPGMTTVRWAFAKRPETFAETEARLERWTIAQTLPISPI